MLKPLLLVLALIPGVALAAPWKLDPSTTVTVDVGWEGKIVPVKFPTISGTIDFDPDRVATTKANIAVATTDATTGNGVVDALVRSADYLGSAKYPQITFRLDKLDQISKTQANITGRVTMRGVTKPVSFLATVFRYGPAKDDPQRFEAGFDLTGSIDRASFGSTGGLPQVASVLPVRIHLLMTSN